MSENILRSDLPLVGQAIREFSFVEVLFGLRNWKYRGMEGQYLLTDTDLFGESDWPRRMDLD